MRIFPIQKITYASETYCSRGCLVNVQGEVAAIYPAVHNNQHTGKTRHANCL
jgi:hypothetical protein